MRLIGLLLLVIFHIASVAAEVKIYRHSDHGLRPVSACVLPWPKRDYIRVCINNRRYAIKRDSAGMRYIEPMFQDTSDLSKCGCGVVDDALDKYYAARRDADKPLMANRNKASKRINRKEVKSSVVDVKEYKFKNNTLPFTCVKCD